MRSGTRSSRLVSILAIAGSIGLVAFAPVASGAPPAPTTTTTTALSRAGAIRDELNARIGLAAGADLAVTEAASTDVVDSFSLLSEDLLETRFVPATGGVWYTLCTSHARCPYPAARHARPASDYLPRRLALELALRTFLETDAPVVGVSLPTAHYVAFVVERGDLARAVDMASLARALGEQALVEPRTALAAATSAGNAAAALRRAVDELTRPRTYHFLGFEAGPYGPTSWAGLPCWPQVDW